MSTSPFIVIDNVGQSLIIRFNRPDQRNPLSIGVQNELAGILDADAENSQKIIFTGADGVFASGADLREIALVTAAGAPRFARRGQRLMKRISGMPQVTIAAIDGACFGGALDLALACDLRIASEQSTFAHPGAGLGIITGWGGTQRLPRLIGRAASLEMFFTAAPIDCERALAVGLISEIAADPLVRALEI